MMQDHAIWSPMENLSSSAPGHISAACRLPFEWETHAHLFTPSLGELYHMNYARSGHLAACGKFQWWCSQSLLCCLPFEWETHAHRFTPSLDKLYHMNYARSGHLAACGKFQW